VFRDPSGALDCLVWDVAGLRLIASGISSWLGPQFKPAWRVDWTKVADMLASPALTSASAALTGVHALSPGAYLPLRPRIGVETQIWRPCDVVMAAEADPVAAIDRLRRAVDQSVAGLAAPKARVLAEISGGLDSAIVVGALRATGFAGRLSGVNYHGPHAEADERVYAQAVADRLHIPLIVRQRIDSPTLVEAWLTHPREARPRLSNIDADYDQAQAELAREIGACAIITGKGGDAILFQMSTEAILADVLRRQGPAGLLGPTLPALSRWMRLSVWSVLGRALLALGRPETVPVSTLLSQETRAALRRTPHPWLGGAANLPPAKRIQVGALTGNLALHGPSRQSEAADILHPLLAQPVLEAGLSIPADVLTRGGRDRGLARDAFADRLPALVRERRSKGVLAVYFGRSIAAGAPLLKSHLLDGLLVSEGLLDRTRVEAALDGDQLIWTGEYSDIMISAIIESWARAWRS
jgi:asparagine synthase (glutamine-hydrolysing)